MVGLAAATFIFHCIITVYSDVTDFIDEDILTTQSFVFWPNASVPFYINMQHFDHEQSTSIMTSLSLFAFKTCLKFAPVLAEPEGSQHVLVFENPGGVRKCVIDLKGHPVDETHKVILGYDCLKSPEIDMVIMRALGFPFEHNKLSRDLYIEVLEENIEPGAIELFTKDNKLPRELRSLFYDVNSVMHFSEREYSRNGHRTIIFKDHNVRQNRVGLTPLDIRKIDIVYGPECRKRDRQEKIDICQNYPGVSRRKREADLSENRSLRVNPEITPPPELIHSNTSVDLAEFGIKDEIEEVVDNIYKISKAALDNARLKYCNNTNSTKPKPIVASNERPKDILGIINIIANYAKTVVDNAISNLTAFCEASDSADALRSCSFYDMHSDRCRLYFKSTKTGRVVYSTQHRPFIRQSTKHYGNSFGKQYGRSGNETEDVKTVTEGKRSKREVKEQKKEKAENVRNVTISTNEIKVSKDTTTVSSRRSFKDAQKWFFEPGQYRKNYKKRKAIKYDKNGESSEITEEVDKSNSKDKFKEERPEEYSKKKQTYGSDGENYSELEKERIKKRKERLRIEEKVKGTHKKPTRGYELKTIPLSKKNREFYNDRMWPDGIVRYIITPDKTFDLEDLRHRIEEVNSILKKKTCVRLQEITEDEARNYEDYLVIDASADYVTGRVGGRQNFGSIEMFRGGQHRQHTAMMVMAMLGFYFEVARHDRDKYVRVHMRHVRPDKLHHFEKIREDATFDLPYDYKSATHPAWQFWRQIGKKGISTVATFKEQDPDGAVMKRFGQNPELLSDLDLVKINSVYGIKCFGGMHKKLRDVETDK